MHPAPYFVSRETVQSDMRIHAAARDEAVQHEELLSSHVKASVATRAELEKDLEARQSDARRELQQRRRLEEPQSRRATCPELPPVTWGQGWRQAWRPEPRPGPWLRFGAASRVWAGRFG